MKHDKFFFCRPETYKLVTALTLGHIPSDSTGTSVQSRLIIGKLGFKPQTLIW